MEGLMKGMDAGCALLTGEIGLTVGLPLLSLLTVTIIITIILPIPINSK
jgi:hypothetical protein